jgi:hypothetical protein
VAAICRSYESHAEAQEAVNAVLGAGIPGGGVRVLMGEPARDAHAGPGGRVRRPDGAGRPGRELR